MEFALISDTHMLPPGERLFGLSPTQRLASGIRRINRSHPGLETVFVLGDLADNGDFEAYRVLRDLLDGLEAEANLLMGNHDNREVARSVFPHLADDGNGFVQYTLDFDDAYCVCLDTMEPGTPAGNLCEKRLDWLDGALASAPAEAPILLFQHHPAFPVCLGGMDEITVRNPEAEWEVLSAHRLPAQLFFGHVHRPVSGHWHGIPVHSQRGTSVQVDWDVGVERKPRTPGSIEDPEYGFVQVTKDQVAILTRNYLYDGPEITLGPDKVESSAD